MERWTALLPDRISTSHHPSTSSAYHPSSSQQKLIGKLPEEAYIQILIHLPLGDFVSLSLTNRRVHRLVLHEQRIWKTKLEYLDYNGPGKIDWKSQLQPAPSTLAEKANKDPSSSAGASDGDNDQFPEIKQVYKDDPTLAATTTVQATEQEEEDEFGDFFAGDVRRPAPATTTTTTTTATTLVDDGFGDFQDSKPNQADDPFGITDDFGDVDLGAQTPKPNKSAKMDADDLMLIFDDDEDESTSRPKSQPPLANSTLTTTTHHSRTDSSALSTSSQVERTSTEVLNLREVFKTHYNLLMPYYLSLVTHTTSSLVFTSNLEPMWRARLLASLARFCQPLVAPTRSLPQRMTVLRNVQSAIDFFESALLAEFERADTRKDEPAMKEKAHVLWELNQSPSVIQVFVQKREIFYDQSHNPLKNLTKQMNPDGQVSDGIDFTAMDAYMRYVIKVVDRDGSLLARAFPPEADVLIYYVERIANDVVSDYITTLLAAAQELPHPLFLLATAATFGQVYRLVDTTISIQPKSPLITKERAEDVIFKMFEPLMDDYLTEEGDWIREVLEGMCAEWDAKTASSLAISDPTFLASSNPAQVKKNVLAGFAKVLLLPVTIIPKTAEYGFNAITYGATGAFNTFANLGTQLGGSSTSKSGSRTPTNAPVTPAAVDVVAPPPLSQTTATIESGATAWGGEEPGMNTPPITTSGRASFDQNGALHFPSTLDERRDSNATSRSASSSARPKSSRFDRMQLLLSLDTALQLIQADRDCLKRIQTFARYPGVYGRKVRDAIEEAFIILLQTLGEKHVVPAFRQATKQMGLYRPEEHEGEESVAPLVQFFELVHIGDTIQQMVEVYFEKEMAAYIDRRDFLNVVIREKKKFESSLDDVVAQGLNAGVNILMSQVEHLITTRQASTDYSPPPEAEMELKSTQACNDVVRTLSTHCDMLRGSTDKQILEVFHQEVGIRLHGLLLKHLKRQHVTIEGGFTLIADLNAFHTFIQSLKQPNITAYFASLKMVGELFIVDSPKELGQLVRDVSRYEGTLSADDLYEIVQCRADWRIIEKQVEKQLFGLKLADDCVIS